jgi:hypothetical protein
VTTGSKGQFALKVCEGQVRLFASSQSGFAQATVEAGDTNVVLQMSRRAATIGTAVRRSSLKGKPLPDQLLVQAKKDGFADKYLAKLLDVPDLGG